MAETEKIVGIIGGSGLYNMPGLRSVKPVGLKTPFGKPSDRYMCGRLAGAKTVFLPRHGSGHRMTPTEINSRANIYGFKALGVTHLISVSAVGSMKEELAPGDVVLPDQFIDRTRQRPQTFFGGGIVAHIQFADPICPCLSGKLYETAAGLGIKAHKGGTYVCIEGPQFSTRAESKLFRSWGVDVIGMTNLPEARLAREAEICYASISLVTDYDCWYAPEEEVRADTVIKILRENISKARSILDKALPLIEEERNCICANALRHAIVTYRPLIPSKKLRDLRPLLEKYFPVRVPSASARRRKLSS